jgi:hypothetical protein
MLGADNKRIALVIPKSYYRMFRLLGEASAPMRFYREYRDAADKLQGMLWDMAPKEHKVIGVHGYTVTLEKTDSPFGSYWTADALEKLSVHFGLWELWHRRANDP